MKLDPFITYLQGQDRAQRTISGYQHDLDAFIAWFKQTHGRRPSPTDVTPLDIREYRQHLTTIRQLKPASVNRRLAALRAYFRWLLENGTIAINPLTSIRDIDQTSTGARWLERKVVFKLLNAATAAIQLAEARGLEASTITAKRNAAILALLLHAGLRVSELCALHLSDVVIKDRSGQVVVRSGKGGKYREIPLNIDARKALQVWLTVRPETDGQPLFMGRRGEALQPRGVQRAIAQLAKAAQLESDQVTPHILRHTFGKSLVDQGVSLDQVGLLLGHESLDTTAIYTKPSQDDLAQAVERVAWVDE